MKRIQALGCLMMLASATAWGAMDGGVSHGGTDNKGITHGSAWFLGEDPVRFCINYSAEFGATREFVRAEFLEATRIWKNYVIDKGVHFAEYANKSELRMVLDYRELSVCDGTEELQILAGVATDESKAEKNRFENPTAFAHRSSFDPLTGRGKGFIWLAPHATVYPLAGKHGFPDWSVSYALRGIFLHEIGHVLGIEGHVDGTIMESDLTHLMQMSWEKRRAAALGHIDDLKILFLGNPGGRNIEVSGETPRFQYLCDDCDSRFFEALMKRKREGKIHLAYSLHDWDAKLTVRDGKGERAFKINFQRFATERFSLANNLFSVVRKLSSSSTGGFSLSQTGESGPAELEGPDGKQIPLLLTINGDQLVRIRAQFMDVPVGFYEVFNSFPDGLEE